ncbi:hypothetical protein LTR56_019951 [Elasticomyces elasticus]|nr:hypothetical protein LTR56_019951 [Elasticomyces elasticus]KAK3634060.1 hypothetical protein LTR22_019792 [Elasticomyces elasticus]KAK4911145.1 hypothetical protein LTR49_020217 [Elasticomyces elasticus]KAK5738498.1 hypothetical protein LTS12_025575 [Elasticomyces elasticus]
MAFGVSARINNLKGSLASKFTNTNAKGKEVVDLTAESDSSDYAASPVEDNDEEIARKLQARYDAEDSAEQPLEQPLQSNDGLFGMRHAYGPQAHTNDDERIARELAAELNGNGPAATESANFENTYIDGGADDEAIAREMQAQFDREHRPSTSRPASETQARAADSTLDPHARRGPLQTFTEGVRHTGCAACGKPALASENELLLKLKPWLESTGSPMTNISSVLKCSKATCSAATCIGCGVQSRKQDPNNSVAVDNNLVLSWCCARGRMVLIWLLICGFDRRKTAERRRDSFFKKPSVSPQKAPNGPNGTGVGYDSEYGFSAVFNKKKAYDYGKYGTYMPGGASRYAAVAGVPASATTEAVEDRITERLLACLDVLLPSLVAENVQDFDLEPPVVLEAVLTQSDFLGTIATLLRNDSLEDATKRASLYGSMLDVVNKLGSHHATAASTIHRTRQVQDHGPDILSLSFASASNSDKAKFEETQSLATCLRNFDKQSKNLLASARAHPQAFKAEDSQQMLSLCRRVSELADFLLANAVPAPIPTPGSNGQTTPAAANDDWQADLAVVELPDNEIMSRHTYRGEAERISNVATGRMKSLSLQLSNLMTSLPPGIFVRHCASRLDVMKILIIGPKGTPYEHGLFEFDLLCPANFPNSPPSMNFRTTGGGRVRFNPNLYNCGKVCLSLLGTWAGEAWEPKKSTILQVLVSIQAMIFCDEPWYNEPGRSTNRDASLRHNQELQGYTVQHALLYWLTPELDPVWGDVVERHFATNAQAIERTVASWGVDYNTRMQLSQAMRRWDGSGRRL